jgi:L,D-transpeptidase catalytic domain
VRRAAFTATALAAVAASATPPATAGERPVRISGVDHTWRWTFVEREVVARRRPDRDAARVMRLGTRTPEGTSNLVLTLARVRRWVKVRLPMLPNNSTGWVRREALGGYTVVRTELIVDRQRLRLRLERRGRTILRAPIGVGEPHWPTPRGRFYVRNKLRGFSSPVYGPVAFGTSARSAVLTDWPGGGFIGIHGTNQPGLLPGRVSHGCIRLRNADIRRLARRMPVGTPIHIR